jgi:hypothetical protein
MLGKWSELTGLFDSVFNQTKSILQEFLFLTLHVLGLILEVVSETN